MTVLTGLSLLRVALRLLTVLVLLGVAGLALLGVALRLLAELLTLRRLLAILLLSRGTRDGAGRAGGLG